MARLRLHGLRLPGLRPWRPIPEPQHRYSRWTFSPADRSLCVGCIGHDQTKGCARTTAYVSCQNYGEFTPSQGIHCMNCGVVTVAENAQ